MADINRSDIINRMEKRSLFIPKWDFWIDRGGTFTDIIARDPNLKIHTLKLLSENKRHYKDAVLFGIRQFLKLTDDEPIAVEKIASVKMGTTVATNALLEHKGEPTVFITTRGFADALTIGDQSRPDIFALEIIKPKMLYSHVVRVTERIAADGTIIIPLDLEQTREDLETAFQKGLRCAAIVLMHSYAYPKHEIQIADLAREIGFTQISVSHQISPLIKFISRADSCVVDAYLSPVLKSYINKIKAALVTSKKQVEASTNTITNINTVKKAKSNNVPNVLHFMQSSGSLIAASLFQAKDAILSGPAGGVIGATQSAKQAGFDKIIGFDMGGTSTDVFHYNGILEYKLETEIAGVKLRVPMLDIHTVAAGGGSLLHFDTHRFRVGPDSAGANPGPACYRNGGQLTLTDANVMTGKIRSTHFPYLFGESGDKPIDPLTVKTQFLEFCQASESAQTPEQIADGFIRIAVENMANAIAQISIQNGHDIAGYALSCFGGAAGQHACLVAEKLGLETIIIHPLSGLLSAYGMGLATMGTSQQISIEKRFNQTALEEAINKAHLLESQNQLKLEQLGISPHNLQHQILIHLRYADSDIAFSVAPLDHAAQMRREFEASHQRRFGFISPEKDIMIEVLEVKTNSVGQCHDEPIRKQSQKPLTDPHQHTQFYSGGLWHNAKLYLRDQLGIGHQLSGPAIIIEAHQTIIVEAGWSVEINQKNHLILSRLPAAQDSAPNSGPTEVDHSEETSSPASKKQLSADPVMVEVFNNLFKSIAKQMGVILQNTAQSVNIRERKDYSCAVFDAQGELVANAPHMPVHLGSMDCSVKAVMNSPDIVMVPGDSYIINAPYNGGTHLPDITVVTPVFDDDGTNILFFVASRGHHVDIGGIAPGSMSPNATVITEEGVYIDCFELVKNSVFQEEALISLLTNAPYPARQPQNNIADLKAQLAANNKGIFELRKAIAHYGLGMVQDYMRFIQKNAEESVRRVISTLDDCYFELETDDHRIVSVTITIDKEQRSAIVDFTDTSPQREDNFNAPEPVTRAAVLYVFRTLVEEDIPLNAGCLEPITLIIPKNSMLSPSFPAAVVAGNVETSQLVTDCLFAALGKLAPSQGTMNNLTFGNEHYQYYETICSGAPAGNGFNGADAVHTHMTNSHLTDPEILELRYPVVLEQFAINRGSGGKGKFHAGDGVLRKIRFLETMNCSILSSYRESAPVGLSGGQSGIRGENWVRKSDGKLIQLKGCDEVTLHAGEAIIIKTPTGGGYGKIKNS